MVGAADLGPPGVASVARHARPRGGQPRPPHPQLCRRSLRTTALERCSVAWSLTHVGPHVAPAPCRVPSRLRLGTIARRRRGPLARPRGACPGESGDHRDQVAAVADNRHAGARGADGMRPGKRASSAGLMDRPTPEPSCWGPGRSPVQILSRILRTGNPCKCRYGHGKLSRSGPTVRSARAGWPIPGRCRWCASLDAFRRRF